MTVEILIIGKGGSRSIILIKCFPLNSIITDIIIFKLFIILCTIDSQKNHDDGETIFNVYSLLQV